MRAPSAAEPYISASCDVTPGIFPSDGSTNVPRNAHAWVFGGTSGDYHLRHGKQDVVLKGTVHDPFRIVEVPLGALEPYTTYTLAYADQVLTTFTTGASNDVEPPAAPDLTWAHLSSQNGLPVDLRFEPPGDTAIMKLTVVTDGRAVSMFAPAASLQHFGAECAGASLHVNEYVCFDLAAIDLAGNRSAAARRCTTVTQVYYRHRGDDFRDRSYDPNRTHWGLVIFMLVFSLVSAVNVVLFRTRTARKAFAASSLIPIAAELVRRLALLQRRNAAIVFGACIVIVAISCGTGGLNAGAVLGAAPIALAVLACGDLWRTHRVLRRLHNEPDHATMHDGNYYLFTADGEWIAVFPSQMELVRKAAVPTAKVR
ncbi:MAG TPA: hypothetical protein VFV99_26125 [Kofleriaceae bacterium]|nr:hypothetical protein [Kofleriaceae bacterium]